MKEYQFIEDKLKFFSCNNFVRLFYLKNSSYFPFNKTLEELAEIIIIPQNYKLASLDSILYSNLSENYSNANDLSNNLNYKALKS